MGGKGELRLRYSDGRPEEKPSAAMPPRCGGAEKGKSAAEEDWSSVPDCELCWIMLDARAVGGRYVENSELVLKVEKTKSAKEGADAGMCAWASLALCEATLPLLLLVLLLTALCEWEAGSDMKRPDEGLRVSVLWHGCCC